MDIRKYNNESKLIEIMNKKEKEHQNETENDSNKMIDNNTTNEDDSIYTIDEVISYCSSPKSGLVSIKKTKTNKDTFLSIGSEISNITNTITFKIAMIKKEISFTEINDKEIERSNTSHKKSKKEDEIDNNIYISNKTYSSKEPINDKDKKDKMKSFFKKKTKRIKDNNTKTNTNEDINVNPNKNIKNKTSKGKKKKTRKSQEKIDINKNLDHSKSSTNIDREKEKNIKKTKKKTQKLKNENDFQKLVKKKYEIEKNYEREKDKDIEKDDKEIDEGKSPKIIILDFSSSGNNEDNEDETDKEEIKINISKEEEKNPENNSNKNNVQVLKNFHKINENDFFQKKNKTINDTDEKNKGNKDLKDEFISERKFITPKSKNSCFVGTNSYKISQTKLDNNNNGRKLSFNYGTKCIMKTKSISRIEDIKKKKDKKRKQTEDFFNICASKNFQHNEENQNKLINSSAIKDNIRKSTKKMKSKNNINNTTINNTNTNNTNHHNSNSRKDSNKSCHNTPNKKFRHIITHNYDKKNINIEKKLNINMTINHKITESSSLNNTPKNLRPKKSVYSSNRHLTKIKISSLAVDNKDIHLEMNGKQETIINYTNQEMVDDENEYMVECFKVLLKLDKSKQPRCKSKVNFNFENCPSEKNKKKIALFDLDETLVHCTKEQKGINGDSVNIKLPTNKVVNVGLNIRPHWKEALDLIKSHYHIVVYTASHQSYADAVLDYLDKENKYFQYRLYRNHCVQCDIDGIKFYVKDLDTLNEKYNLKDVVLIDNSVLSFAYHLNNGIPIVPYIEQKEDSQLLMLAYYLVSIANFDDLTEENKKHINIEHFILQVKNLENEEEENDEEDVDDNTESKNDNNETNNNENNDNSVKENIDDKNPKNVKKQVSLDSKKGKKLTCRKSEKALKIANDMKQNMVDVYNKNYN